MKETNEQLTEWVKKRGIHVTYCPLCEVYSVCCPECGSKFCGFGCDCMPEFLSRMQDEVDTITEQ